MDIVSIENAEHYKWGENCDGWHLVQSETLSVIEERVPPGSAEVRHYHEMAEQFFYVLAGEVVIECDGAEHLLMATQGLHVPPGAYHKLSNNSDKDARFIVASTPPSHGDRVTQNSP